MAFKLQDFRSAIRDLARSYQFECEINFPTIVGPSSLASILVESTKIPTKTYEATPANFMGQPHYYAGKATYDAWACKMRIDDNLDIYKKMRAWSEVMIGTETNIAAFPNGYKSTINLYQLDVAGNRLVSFELNGAWLTSIGDIALNYAEHTPQTADMTFEYDYFVFKVL
jgi:hypothetical protein